MRAAFNNTMDANQIGLFLNWAVIGQQGSSKNPRDNQWLGTSWNASNPNTRVEGTNGALSPFYVRSSAPYNPQYNTWGSGGSVLAITTTSGSWGGGCVYTDGASFKTDEAESEAIDDLLSIINMPEPQTDRERSLQWMGLYGLYKRLQADNGLMSSAQELAAFYEAEDNANMGKLHRAVAGLKAARQGSVGAATLSDLQTLQPTNQVEQTLQEVLDILYANATDLTGMPDGDEIRLREIAQLCPLDYGFGVYTARSALLKLDTLPKHYASECERVPSPEQISEKKPEEQERDGQFSVYPNPNDGTFILNYILSKSETGTIEVFSAIGQRVYIGTLQPGSQSDRIVLEHMTTGIHQLRVTVNGETRMSTKLVILN